MIGNSSSGLYEAPFLGLTIINIGNRQKNRFRGKNVIDVFDVSSENILKSVKKAMSKKFKSSLNNTKNPYGNGNSSVKIINILEKTKISKKLLTKHLTY